MLDLFADEPSWQEPLADGAVILRRFAVQEAASLIEQISSIARLSPFRQMATPGGYRMSVAMTNCGERGWATDSHGYIYAPNDPLTGNGWPAMPELFQSLCRRAARAAGYQHFVADACLINRYAPGAKLSLHQDKDEPDLRQPIVSISLGLPAVFQFGGLTRHGPLKRVRLEHGDVVVWGGASRLAYHGILPLKPGVHYMAGEYRYNLTFRQTAQRA